MADGFKFFNKGVQLTPTTTPGTIAGDLRVNSAGTELKFHNGTSEASLLKSATVYNVKDYGATGDGTTDDTSAIETAVAAAASGGQIYFPTGTYKCSSDLNVSVGSVWILGEGQSSKLVFADGYGLRINISNVKISDLWLDGQNYSTGTSTGNIIQARGTNSSNYLENIIVDSCYITNVPQTGINLRFVQNFKLTNNRIENVYYAGISIESGTYGEITNNQVIDINPGSIAAEAYGIAVSRNESDLVTAPRSKNVLVSHNVIHNNPVWEGLDTHSGDYIVFSNNIITACKLGIVVAADGESPANYPPRYCTVSNNTIDSQVTSGSASYGIVVAGDFDSNDYALACTVTGNTISRHGDESSSTGCALYFYATQGLTVAGNSILEAGANAIYLSVENYGFSITGNTIVDVFSNTIGRATGIYSQDSNQTGVIHSNVFATATKSATSVMTQAMKFLNTQTGYAVAVGQNYWAGTFTDYIADAPSGVTGFNLNGSDDPVLRFFNRSGRSTYVINTQNNGATFISSGSDSSLGRNIAMYSSSHATLPSTFKINRGSTTELSIDSVGAIEIGANPGTQRIMINGYMAHNYSTNNQGYSLLSSQGGTAGFNVMGASASENLGRNMFLYSSAHASLANIFRIRNATAVQFEISSAGAITLGSTSSTAQHVINGLASTTATAGTVHTIPGTVVEYLTVTVNGNTRKIPLFAS